MCSVDGAKEHIDRLSGLPEELLAEILSLVPLKTAIATGILSRRWRDLWTKLPSVKLCVDSDFYKHKHFENGNIYRYYENDFSEERKRGEFFTIIDNILSKLSSTSLRSVNLNLGHYKENKLYSDTKRNCYHIRKWFNWTCGNRQKVEEFRFTVLAGFRTPYGPFFPLHPLWLFQMTSLVVLELRPWFYLSKSKSESDNDYDYDYDFNLPNLKKLNVELFPWNPRILEKLVSSSSSLEDLCFLALWVRPRIKSPNSHTLHLSSHTLKRLTMDLQLKDPIHVIVNAPNLDYLGVDANIYIIESNSRYRLSFVNPPTTLVAASVYTHWLPLDQFFLPCNFFTLLSTVTSLSIVNKKDTMIEPITFPRLTHLKLWLGDDCRKLSLFEALLKKCPLLEALTLDLTDFSRSSILPYFPPQLVASIKRIELVANPYVYRLENTLLHLLYYILGNAQDLELLRIIINRSNHPPLPDEYEYDKSGYNESHLIKQVSKVPRRFLQCRVEFYGLRHVSVVNRR